MNALAHVLTSIFVPLFFIGMIGSLLVVVFTLIRDLRQVFLKEDKHPQQEL